MNIDRKLLEEWMAKTLDCAWHAVSEGQNPFAAAVYTPSGKQLSLEANTVQRTKQVSRHGEVNAIDAACQSIGNVDLSGHILVTTGEPCPMCAATVGMAKLDVVVFGASTATIEKAGYGTLGVTCEQFFLDASPKPRIIAGVLEDRCDELLLKNPMEE